YWLSRTWARRCASPIASSACSREGRPSKVDRVRRPRQRSRLPTSDGLAGPDPQARRELGQRGHPGGHARWPLCALCLRIVAALRRGPRRQSGPRRLRRTGGLPRARGHYGDPRAGAAHLRHRRATFRPVRLRRAAVDHSEESRSLTAHNPARHLRTFGRHPERAPGLRLGGQSFLRCRPAHLRIAADHTGTLDRIRLPAHLLHRGRRAGRSATLSIEYSDGSLHPRRCRRPGSRRDRGREHASRLWSRRRDCLRHGGSRGPRVSPAGPDPSAAGSMTTGLAASDQTSPRAVRVTRARRSSLWGLTAVVAAVIGLATLPYLVYADVTDFLINAFILLVLASMWN